MSDGREETNRATEELRPCGAGDAAEMFAIINDGASAYKGVIPADRWHEPYMGLEELEGEIAAGVAFWGYGENGRLLGVMGIQDKGEVALIRHAYVCTAERRRGIGGRLLVHLLGLTAKPVLIGTWADAWWAVDFYRRHGFRVVSPEEKDCLLRRFWSIPARQVETSVVLASEGFRFNPE